LQVEGNNLYIFALDVGWSGSSEKETKTGDEKYRGRTIVGGEEGIRTTPSLPR